MPSEPCLQPGKCSHPMQVAQEKLRAEIYGQVNRCNLLLEQVKQRSQAREQLQRRLQQLQQDAQMEERQHQAQAQVPEPLPGLAAPVGVSVKPAPLAGHCSPHMGSPLVSNHLCPRWFAPCRTALPRCKPKSVLGRR